MLKKILTIALLAGLSAVLIWGGVNRTLARTGEGNTLSAESTARGSGRNDTGDPLRSEMGDCEDSQEKIQGQGGVGGRGNPEENNSGDNAQAYGNQGQSNQLTGSQGSNGESRGNGGGNGGGQGGGYEPLDEAEIEALHLALDDEYHALAVYQQVIADFGEVTPFVEIVQSESRHIDALLKQFEKHGLIPPENSWSGNIPSFESMQAACQAGVEAELANVALYEQLFSMTDDAGLIQVFTNLSRASQESHLPEFQSCL